MPRNIDENNPIPRHLISRLGIQRDGTQYRSEAYIDGQWVRFFHEWPEKMLGYETLYLGDGELIDQIFGISQSVSIDVYMGRGSSLRYFNLGNDNSTVGPILDRTPISGFVPNTNNIWSFAQMSLTDGADKIPYIIGQVNAGWDDVASQTDGPVFYGQTDETTPLVQAFDGLDPSTAIEVSGGVVALPSVLVAYGNNGIIYWTRPNSLTEWFDLPDQTLRNQQSIAQTKIVTGMKYFGNILFWSINSLISATYVPPQSSGGDFTVASYWATNVLSENISILSASCAVQYNQLVFWVGQGQFYVFNGAVARLENTMCANWFFDNLNEQYQSKCFSWVNTQYDEIWFCFPFGEDATECNAAAIYSVSRQVWYTSTLDRSAAMTNLGNRYPILASSALEKTLTDGGGILNSYPIWLHEKGVNKVLGSGDTQQILPIKSYFEYPIFDLYSSNPSSATNILVQTMRIEPDFIMPVNTSMTVTIRNRMFAQENAIETGPLTFDINTKYIDGVVSQGRQVSIRFDSNMVDGYYEVGKILHDFIPGDVNA